MSAVIEQQIVDLYRTLRPDAQERVREILVNSVESEGDFNFEEWQSDADETRERLRLALGDNASVGVTEILRELREERSWPASY